MEVSKNIIITLKNYKFLTAILVTASYFAGFAASILRITS